MNFLLCLEQNLFAGMPHSGLCSLAHSMAGIPYFTQWAVHSVLFHLLLKYDKHADNGIVHGVSKECLKERRKGRSVWIIIGKIEKSGNSKSHQGFLRKAMIPLFCFVLFSSLLYFRVRFTKENTGTLEISHFTNRKKQRPKKSLHHNLRWQFG